MSRSRLVMVGACGLCLVVGVVVAVIELSSSPVATSTSRVGKSAPKFTTVPKFTNTVPKPTTKGPKSSSTVPKSTTTVPKSTTTTVPVPKIYTVPNTIPDDCSVDVTIPLWDWLNGLAQPGPGVVYFQHNGCYLVNGSLDLRNWRDYTFDGDGATLEQTHVYGVAYQYTDNSPAPNGTARCATPGTANTTGFQAEGVWGPCTVTPYPDGRTPLYCGSNTTFGATNINSGGYVSTDQSWGIMLNVEGGCDLTFRNFHLVGSYGTGTNSDTASSTAQDSLVEFNGTQRVLWTGNTETNPWGDWISLFAVHETPFLGSGVDGVHYPSTDITITDNNFEGTTGRQGISVVFASRVDIGKNFLANAGATMFDIEWDGNGGCECDVNIHQNIITGKYAYLIAAYTGAIIRDFAFTNNIFPNMKIWMVPPSNSQQQGDGTTDIPHDVTIVGNTATQPPDWPRPDIYTANIYNVLIADNATPIRSPGAVEPFVQSYSTWVTVRSNTLTGPGTQQILSTTQPNNTQCNDVAVGAAADGATCAAGYVTPKGPTAPALPGQ